jgi:hypothetical protein
MATVLRTPRRALVELDERRKRMRSRVDGRVLDVAEHTRSGLRDLVAAGDRFDTVLSVGQISTAPDGSAMCHDLAAVLEPDGCLLFLEPTSVVGPVGALQHALGPWMWRTTGRRPDYDVPALLRGAGLSISDCERFEAHALWPYRSFVEGVARVAHVRNDAPASEEEPG